MKKVTIYTTRFCPYCVGARQLLEEKGVEYHEIKVDSQSKLRREMMDKSGRHTVPQIWVGETHVGGFDELSALDRSGRLGPMLMHE